MIITIAWRELKNLFISPLAWVILGVLQLILAYLFLGHVDLFLTIQGLLTSLPNPPGLTELVAAPVLGNAGVFILLITPFITMRLVAEERRNKTLTLLTSAPLSVADIILGKYLGALLFFFVIIGLTVLMPLSLLIGGHLDFGTLASALLGLVLLTSTCAAIGLFMSTLTQHPSVAAASTFGILFALWIVNFAGHGHGAGGAVIAYLSIVNHYEPFLRGLFDTSNLAYYLILIVTFLTLSVRRLEADRTGA